jgi:hypothetical protein
MRRSTFDQPTAARDLVDTAHGHQWNGTPWRSDLAYPDMTAAGLRTTPSDLAQVIIEVQRALRGDGVVLNRQSASEMVTPAFGGPAGLGFFVSGEGVSQQFSHDGWNYGFTCKLVGFVNGSDGAVVMTNQDTGVFMLEAVDAIARTYGWAIPSETTRRAIPITKASASRIVGRYSWVAGVLADVVQAESARIFVVLSREPGARQHEMVPFPPIEIFATSEAEFFSVVPHITIQFDLDGQALVHQGDGPSPVRAVRVSR